MFISNAMNNASNVLSGNRVFQQARGATERLEALCPKESKAAVYDASKLSDYDGKKLDSLQEDIMKLRERIEEVKSDTKMNQEKKESKLDMLNTLLSNLQERLTEQEAQQAEEALQAKDQEQEKEKGKKTQQVASEATEQVQGGKDGGAVLSAGIFAAGTSLEQLATLGDAAGQMERRADMAQRQLKESMYHKMGHIPTRASTLGGNSVRVVENCLRLKDPKIIERRQAEVGALQQAAERLQDAVGKAAQGVPIETKKAGLSEKVSEAASDKPLQQEAAGTLLER